MTRALTPATATNQPRKLPPKATNPVAARAAMTAPTSGSSGTATTRRPTRAAAGSRPARREDNHGDDGRRCRCHPAVMPIATS